MSFNQKKADQIAQSLLGMNFKMGGRGPKEIDCYGVLIYFFKQFGIGLPDYSYLDDWDAKEEYYLKEYSSFFRRLGQDESLEIGDVILFTNVEGAHNHAGVYIGDNRFIHAYQKIGTKIDRITNLIWQKKIYGYFRTKDG